VRGLTWELVEENGQGSGVAKRLCS
jgi:hypothetical protein